MERETEGFEKNSLFGKRDGVIRKNIIIMKIRSYSKQELAMLYFPDSDPRTATCHLMRWINRNPTLLQELKSTGYYRSSKYFTTRQVCMILDYLGDP